MVMGMVSACLAREGEPPVVLADWTQGGVLASRGKVRVVGSGYGELQGLRDGHELYSTDSEQRFWELAQQRLSVLFRPPMWMLEDTIGNAYRVFGRGTPTPEQIRRTVIWRIASSDDFPTVPAKRWRGWHRRVRCSRSTGHLSGQRSRGQPGSCRGPASRALATCSTFRWAGRDGNMLGS